MNKTTDRLIARREDIEQAIIKEVILPDLIPDNRPLSIRATEAFTIMEYKHEIRANVVSQMADNGFQLLYVENIGNDKLKIVFNNPRWIGTISPETKPVKGLTKKQAEEREDKDDHLTTEERKATLDRYGVAYNDSNLDDVFTQWVFD